MAKRNKREHEEPKAPEPTEKVGAEHVVRDMAKPALFQIMDVALHHLADHKPVDVMLRGMSPALRAGAKVMPSAIVGAMDLLPIRSFASRESADFIVDLTREIAESCNRIIQEKGKLTPDEAAETVKAAAETVRAKKVLIGPLGDFHIPSCKTLLLHCADHGFKPEEIEFGEALDQKMCAGHCCHARIAERLRAAMPSAKRPSGKMSFLQRIGTMEDGELRDGLIEWITAVAHDEAKFKLYAKALGEIDEDGEAEALMAFPADVREKMLPFLRARNATHAVEDGIMAAIAGVREFDSTTLAAKVSERAASRATTPRRSILARIVRGTTL